MNIPLTMAPYLFWTKQFTGLLYIVATTWYPYLNRPGGIGQGNHQLPGRSLRPGHLGWGLLRGPYRGAGPDMCTRRISFATINAASTAPAQPKTKKAAKDKDKDKDAGEQGGRGRKQAKLQKPS
jgi:hypothetical protein